MIKKNNAKKVLTTNMRDMGECELVSRKIHGQIPPKVEYTLTDIGIV